MYDTIRAQIFTDSEEQEVIISGSKFTANLASQRGGAICAVGTDLLSVDGCAFESNEVISQTLDTSGGDIFAISGVALVVADSTFAGSTAQYGGAAIECCGAVITNCNFDNTDAASEDVREGPHRCVFKVKLTIGFFFCSKSTVVVPQEMLSFSVCGNGG